MTKEVAASSFTKPRTGRPPSKPPRNAVELVYQAAANGASLKGLYSVLKCSPEVFNRWLDEFPELREALESGREAERRTLHNKVFEIATQGEGRDALLAAFFLLKARHGYREGDQEAQANRVSINFALPGAMPLEQFTIENAATDSTQSVSAKPLGITRGG